MPLRRVTLSGRLARYESEKPEPPLPVIVKGLFAMAVDTAIGLAVAIFAYKVFMGSLVPPQERGFYCHEVDDINRPYRPNTVSSKHLLAVCLALPFVVIFCAEAVFFYYASGTNRLRKYFAAATYTYLEYLITFTIAVLIIEGSKCVFARLRPHYLSVCKPNWDLINCTDPHSFIQSAHCSGTDQHRIKIGRQSFPSGHSAAAVHFLVFLYLYLTGLIKASNLNLLRPVRSALLAAVSLWTVIVLVTRITDHWHHPTDVLGGIILGFLCVYLPFGRRDGEFYNQRRLVEHLHSV